MTDSSADPVASPRFAALSSARGRLAVFVVVTLAWIALDFATKTQAAHYRVGELIAGPIAGSLNIRLVHNTGAAWGIFSGSTFALGLFSLAICAVLVAYFLFSLDRTSLLETAGLALIVGGGAGNAIDRFAQGYVVDFLEVTFIEFPVFNVADIGVTCGFVLLALGMIRAFRAAGNRSDDGGEDA